jgi:hypothetical protein
MTGSWDWTADPKAEAACLPAPIAPGTPSWEPVHGLHPAFTVPRTGLAGDPGIDTDMLADEILPEFHPEDRVLVIGSGEHVWSPFLFAEAVEKRAHMTRFICTTRSPIVMSDVIQKKMIFPDHFGIGIEMYLHNVDPSEWDRIVIFTETTSEGVAPELRAALGHGHIIDGRGAITEIQQGSPS